MEAKLGYSKNERTDNENYRNGYYVERTVATEMGKMPVKVRRDRNLFPTDISLLKVLYLSTLKAEKKWLFRAKNWDLCLSPFRIMYEGRT